MRWLFLLVAGVAGTLTVALATARAQPGPRPAPPAAALLTGRILHPTAATVVLEYGTDWLSGEGTHRLAARLTPTGAFRLPVPAAALGAVWLYHGQEYTPLYLAKGDAPRLIFDARYLDETIRYTGVGASTSNYLAQHYRRFEDDDVYEATPVAKASGFTAGQMRAYTDAYRHRQTAFLDSFARRHPLPPAFRAYARRAIDYGWANDLQLYPMAQMLNQRARRAAAPAPLPASYFDFQALLPLANDSALANEPYRSYLASYLHQHNLADSLLRPGGAPFAAIVRRLGPGRCADYAVAQLLYDKLETDGPGFVGPLLPAYQRYAHDSAFVRTVRRRYRRLLPLQPGRLAPDFTLRDEADQPVSLHDFRGKVVYLDFWASWCGPCVAEVPATARLRQQFAGREVVFLAVSIDQQPAAWRKALDRLNLRAPNARHLIDPHTFDAASLRAYEVRGVPTYWLIGRDGRIVQGNAPRPSDSEKATAALEGALAH
ncbi:TlpA family protein disulfide reductase [Hymenobacter terricola]|uniref:TlpA family protein disulfide reductase n=1 Tax=Hymenobacter terricola TaxID=2819236 RepID=UPI001B308632|nr:TlpA disulfide reductase family protein [Hymenobacter terricola]